jgi:hypothetical protein
LQGILAFAEALKLNGTLQQLNLKGKEEEKKKK